MRLVDLQLSFPAILVALMILAVLGKGVVNVVLALVIVRMGLLRAHRARRRAGGAAARIHRGGRVPGAAALARIMFRHLLPNCLPPLIVIGTHQVARAIALEATLSFLGLGVPITEPSLGLLIANGYQYMLSGKYWISFYPGIALLVTIVADQPGRRPVARRAEPAAASDEPTPDRCEVDEPPARISSPAPAW